MVMMQSVMEVDSCLLSTWRPLPLGRPNTKPINPSPLKEEISELSGPITPGEVSSTDGSVSGDDCSDDSTSTAPSEHSEELNITETKQQIVVPEVVVQDESSTPQIVDIRAPEVYDAFAPAATRLRYMIKNSDHIIKCPGVYDGLSARIAIDVGFEGMYMYVKSWKRDKPFNHFRLY